MIQRLAYNFKDRIGKVTTAVSVDALDVRSVVATFRAIDENVKLVRIYNADRLLGSAQRTSSKETSHWYATLADGKHISVRF